MAWHGVQLPHHWLEFVSTLVGGRGRRRETPRAASWGFTPFLLLPRLPEAYSSQKRGKF